MCGLAGFIAAETSNFAHESILRSMGKKILHRGPDGENIFSIPENGIGLAHQRLAILDLTDAGSQPMQSRNGNFVIAFNGEIYNHLDIRILVEEKLKNPILWNGHSDTETLLAAFEIWGIQETLNKCVGMFALAVWDKSTAKLTLARDRLGEKPLYYGWVNDSFVFASELKAIKIFPSFSNSIDRDALASYLQYTYVPAPMSIYENIFKLLPGHLMEIDRSSKSNTHNSSLQYWSLSSHIKSGQSEMITDETMAIEELDSLLMQSIKSQMISDVPLGAFLSGGIDSSLIVALMQKESMKPIKTFTIGFEDANYDESPYAKGVASYLNTDHHALIVSETETQSVIPLLGDMYDEPFADSSQIPTYLVCKAAKEYVTVALSGDAGDELFGGYNRYFWGPRVWNKLSWMPYEARKLLGKGINAIPTNSWDKVGHLMNKTFFSNSIAQFGDKAKKLGARLEQVRSMQDLYFSLVREWDDPSILLKDFSQTSQTPENLQSILSSQFDEKDPELSMMFCDTMTYLPDDILCKVDRAAMATSLETRVPFLDHRIAEFAWKLPLNMKIRDGQGKWILRKILSDNIPNELIDRPKTGFGIPVGHWLRGPLRDWADDLLNPSRINAEGYFHEGLITKIWNQHLDGSHDWTAKLWTILMFQAWLSEQNINNQDHV
jgi:asparagine synthase (glutamine-hydrolysing)